MQLFFFNKACYDVKILYEILKKKRTGYLHINHMFSTFMNLLHTYLQHACTAQHTNIKLQYCNPIDDFFMKYIQHTFYHHNGLYHKHIVTYIISPAHHHVHLCNSMDFMFLGFSCILTKVQLCKVQQMYPMCLYDRVFRRSGIFFLRDIITRCKQMFNVVLPYIYIHMYAKYICMLFFLWRMGLRCIHSGDSTIEIQIYFECGYDCCYQYRILYFGVGVCSTAIYSGLYHLTSMHLYE